MNAKSALATIEPPTTPVATRHQVIFSVPSGTWPASITNYSETQVAQLVEDFPEYHFFIATVVI